MPVRTLSLLTFALWAGAAHAADPVAWLIDPIDLVHGTALQRARLCTPVCGGVCGNGSTTWVVTAFRCAK